jgi:hypothetical protein
MIPLFFQAVLQDSPSEAGMRLVIPSLATPVGGLIAGLIMSRHGRLSELVRIGCFLMMLGNGLVASLRYKDAPWKYLIYLIPANLGQGMAYPAILFTFLAAFDHSRKNAVNIGVSLAYCKFRTSRINVDDLPLSLAGHCLGGGSIVHDSSERPSHTLATGIVRGSWEGEGNLLCLAATQKFGFLTTFHQIIDDIRHSVTVLNDLPLEIQNIARQVYFEALRYAFIGSTAIGAVALFSAFFARGRNLNRD